MGKPAHVGRGRHQSRKRSCEFLGAATTRSPNHQWYRYCCEADTDEVGEDVPRVTGAVREDRVLHDLAHRCVHGAQQGRGGPPSAAGQTGDEHGQPEDEGVDHLVPVGNRRRRPRHLRRVEDHELEEDDERERHPEEPTAGLRYGHRASTAHHPEAPAPRSAYS